MKKWSEYREKHRKRREENLIAIRRAANDVVPVKVYIGVVIAILITMAIPPFLYCGVELRVLLSEWSVYATIYYVLVAFISYRFLLIYIRRHYIKPLYTISRATEKVTKGDLSVRIPFDEGLGNKNVVNKMTYDFNKMVEELSSTETLKNDFIANVSHEIKTPLAIINNYSTALLDKNLSEEERKEYTETIIGATDRLSLLVGNILRLNKIENKKIVPQKEQYDLCRQLCDCALMFEEMWEKKNIEFEVAVEDKVIVFADMGSLEILWNNLFSNAFKFTGNGGKVRLSEMSDEKNIIVKIEDNGCGMSKETISHIFEKFYQGDTSHFNEGNGLGLALVKTICEMNNIKIDVESEIGKGSVFTVSINRDSM